MNLILIFCGIILQTCFAIVENRKQYQSALLLKAAAAFCFVLLGWRCKKAGLSFCNWIMLGLIFGMAGDVLLNLRYLVGKKDKPVFLVGILAFLIGHVMYLIALISQAKQGIVIPAMIGIVLAAILLKWIFSVVEVDIAFKVFGIFYVGAVSLMAVFGIWDWIQIGGNAMAIFAVGGLLFLISDLVLIFNTFRGGEPKMSMRAANLSMYYLGQLLIAGCMFFL